MEYERAVRVEYAKYSDHWMEHLIECISNCPQSTIVACYILLTVRERWLTIPQLIDVMQEINLPDEECDDVFYANGESADSTKSPHAIVLATAFKNHYANADIVDALLQVENGARLISTLRNDFNVCLFL